MHSYNLLCNSRNSIVQAISRKLVSKTYRTINTEKLQHEIKMLRYANSINNLVVRLINVDSILGRESLIFERLFSVNLFSITMEELETYLDVFQSQLSQLHERGFIHNDLNKSHLLNINRPEGTYTNIILTDNGFRLVDCELAFLKSGVVVANFTKFAEDEMEEFEQFKNKILAQKKEHIRITWANTN